MANETTSDKGMKKLHSRAAFVRWEKGVHVRGEILRKSIRPSRNPRYADEKIVQVMLSAPVTFKKKTKDSKGNEKVVTAEVAANSPVNIVMKGDCSAVYDLPDGTVIDVLCGGKNAEGYWDFEVSYSE